jgi:hypothetical protein
MRHRKLLPLAAALLGLTAPAFAEPSLGVSIRRPTLSSSLSIGHRSLSIGHRGVSFDARVGNVGLSIGHTSSRRQGYVTPRCEPPRRWVAGHYETVEHRVWVAETRSRVWCEPVWATRYDSCGRAYRVIVRSGRYDWVTVPGHYEVKTSRVWVPAGWR